MADRNQSLQITGNGDVLEPHDGIIAIGSGRWAAGSTAAARLVGPALGCMAGRHGSHLGCITADQLTGAVLPGSPLASGAVAVPTCCAGTLNLPMCASGCSPYALAAARALIDQPDMDALAIGALHTCACGVGMR